MRRLVALFAILALFIVALVAVVALRSKAIPGDCDVVGTGVRDVKTGSRASQVFCVLAGNDYVHGKGGDDLIRAGSGNDTAIGGVGRDRVIGSAGNDELFTVDNRGGDRVAAGAGRDRCYIDPGDHSTGCDRVFFSFSPEMARALQSNLLQVMGIAEGLLENPTATLPVPVPTVTIARTTVTKVVAPSICNEDPPDPPPFCPSPVP